MPAVGHAVGYGPVCCCIGSSGYTVASINTSPRYLKQDCRFDCRRTSCVACAQFAFTSSPYRLPLVFMLLQGGDVVCCDGCRAVYHLACINMESLPDEDFFCPLCSCKECNGPCRDRHPAVSIQTEMVPVHTRPLKVSPLYMQQEGFPMYWQQQHKLPCLAVIPS